MNDHPVLAEYTALVTGIEPAARVVPGRAMRRAIRQSRDAGTFRPRAVHDRSWWVRPDHLFEILTPAELGLASNEPGPDLLLLPAPDPDAGPVAATTAWRTLFHAELDRAIDAAFRDGRLTDADVRKTRRDLGPPMWQSIRTVLREENLIGETDRDDVALREFVAFALEVRTFTPDRWADYFPGLGADCGLLATIAGLVDADGILARTKPPGATIDRGHHPANRPIDPARHGPAPEAATIDYWTRRGNDLKAAVLLERAGNPAGREHLGRLLNRVADALGLDGDARRPWLAAFESLLPAASVGGWPTERRLLYELQRASLAVERTTYAADLIEWVRTLGRRPLKRPLAKTRWVEAGRRLRAALSYAERLPHDGDAAAVAAGLELAVHAAEERAREDLRPAVVETLDDVGLVPTSEPERRSRDKLVEELLDAAIARGFLRIGDLRDAIARNRVKLPDLRGPGEWLRGDLLLQANERLPVRLDGVYRRGEVYMRLLQRGCSLFFGTRPGRWFSMFVALPFGGAFILLEAILHLVAAGEGLVHWLSGWTATTNGVGLLGGGMAITLARNPTLAPEGVSREAVAFVGVFLLLMLHWPAFRHRVGRAARLLFVKAPRAVRRSEFVQGMIHNRATRVFRRYLLLPTLSGGIGVIGTWLLGGDAESVALVGGGAALLAGTFFRTPFGREMEDRLDEAMERVWRVVSVNFAIGALTLIVRFFQAIFEAIERGIYAVDEWLRFREGESRGSFWFKLAFGAVWFVATYIFRFAWTLLVEPQINPVKHFPVVTVSHKILLPMVPSLAQTFGIAKETMWSVVFGIPGIFGFLAWELKENWKLYRANAPKGLRPIQVGSHGESVRGLLRPGFHSGTIPKQFVKLRRAARTGNAHRTSRCHHAIAHVAEGVARFGERSLVADLRHSTRWGGAPIELGELVLGPSRILLPVHVGLTAPIEIALEHEHGWIIGSIAGPLDSLEPAQRAAFADALLGFYKRAGVHAVRGQVAVVFGPQAYQFDAQPDGLLIPLADGKEQLIDFDETPEVEAAGRKVAAWEVMLSECPLLWADWVARWEADKACERPTGELLKGWTVLG